MSEESLLESEEKTEETQEPEGGEPSWFWNEDQPGSGDTPEWLKADKYKTVADQAKAYTDLEKKLGAFTGAPEEYETPKAEDFASSIELPEGVDFNIDPEDPLLQTFIPMAKEMGVSQEGFNKLVGMYIQQQANDYASTMTSMAEEKERLGANAEERLGNIDRWAKANMDDELYQKLANSLTTAEAVEAVEHLIGKARNSKLPNPAEITPRPGVTKQEVDELMAAKDDKGKLRYVTDPIYRKSVEAKMKSLWGTEPHREIRG